MEKVSIRGIISNKVNKNVIKEKKVDLDFSEGNQKIVDVGGNFFKSVVVKKPTDFIDTNIRYGATVGGVEGDFSNYGDLGAAANEVKAGKKVAVNGVDVEGTLEEYADSYTKEITGNGTYILETANKNFK